MSPKINLLHGLCAGQSWVRVGLSVDSASFTREHLRALEHGAAEYLGLDSGAVKTLSVTRWEPAVVLQLPRDGARRLVSSFAKPDRGFQCLHARIPIGDVAADSLPIRPEPRPQRSRKSQSVDLGKAWRLAGSAFVGLLSVVVLTIPALALWIFGGFRRLCSHRGKSFLPYAAGVALPASLTFLFVFWSVLEEKSVASDLASFAFLSAVGIAAYLNLSAIHHLRQSVAFTHVQVVSQILLLSVFLFVGALFVLYVLGENHRRPWSSGLLLSPSAVRTLLGGPRRG